jgi:hypothetical protein
MSNFLLINEDTKINLDLVRSFRYHKSTSSVYITFSDGASEKYFVPDDFEFESVTNVHHVNTIPAEENRYIVVFNVDLENNASDAVGWMERHQVIGWERINHKTMPITTQYLQKNHYNKKTYILDIKEHTVREIGKEDGLEKTKEVDLDFVVNKGYLLEDHAEYIRNVFLEIAPENV